VQSDGQEHRRAARRAVFGHAVIKGPNFEAVCVVRDLSATGARIEVRTSSPLPEEFNLLLSETQTSRHVALVWRRGVFAGVAFCRSVGETQPEGGGHVQPESGGARASSPASMPLPPGTSTGPDQRLTPRRDVLGHCLIVTPNLKASAVIRDISATGAKLAVASHIKLPREFRIIDPKTNSARLVTLRWRDGNFAGVQFCKPVPKQQEDKIWHV
jgi:PilZ domain